MTTYSFTEVAGTTLASFDPATDTLVFPSWFHASFLVFTASGPDTIVTADGTSVTLSGISVDDLAASAFVFPSGSVLGIGNTGNDSFTGGLGQDLFLLEAGGDDSASGGDAADRFNLGAALNAADAIHGGGGVDILYLAGDYAETVVLGENTVRAVERIVLGTGGIVKLQIHQSLLSTALGSVVFDGTLQAATDAFFLDAGTVTSEFQVLGGSGNDTLLGGARDNDFEGGEGDNLLVGRGGNDRLRVNSYGKGEGNSTLFGGAGNDSLYASDGDGDNVLYGGTGSDLLMGGDGDDLLYAAGAQDAEDEAVTDEANSTNQLYGGLGNDTLYGDAGADGLFGGENDDRLEGGGGNDSLLGGYGDDVLDGGAGNDTLDGGAGADTMAGGGGDDTYSAWDETDVIVEESAGGKDTVIVYTGVFTLPAYVENAQVSSGFGIGNVRLQGNGGDNKLSGAEGNDTLIGGEGNDTLSGGSGTNHLEGGAGDDVYTLYGNAGDRVVESAGEGVDTVLTWADVYTLPVNVENGTILSDYGSTMVGNAGNNVLVGAGFCTLSGGAGDDTLRGGGAGSSLLGGKGDDVYEVTSTGARVTEAADGGFDVVVSSVLYTLGKGVEKLVLTGAATAGYGNTLDNVLQGNARANTLAGNGGEDTLIGGGGNDNYFIEDAGDVIVEQAGGGTDLVMAKTSYVLGANVENLTLIAPGAFDATGNDLDNVIKAREGNNVLDGGAGADTLIGDEGNDTYVVDQAGDVIKETGDYLDIDTVRASIDYILSSNLENLVLIGMGNLDGTGNNRNNRLTGNSGRNVLDAGLGNDSLQGAGGDDKLLGGEGDDVLDGGEGRDTLDGGAGNDTYVVDSVEDLIIEGEARDSADKVIASIDWTLGDFLEDLTLVGTANLNGTGNELDNHLMGNQGNNRLDGGSNGFDRLTGGAGDDTYVVNSFSTKVEEDRNGGYDTVLTGTTVVLARNVEKLVLTGNLSAGGTGNAGANTLIGNAAANTLDGGRGADTMAGGDGDDTYVVDDVGDVVSERAAGGTDRVESRITYTLGANLENLTLAGFEQISGTGNAGANLLAGNGTHNTLDGGRGNDVLAGMGGTDHLLGGAGDDTLIGGTDVDVLYGEAGRDVFRFLSARETEDIIADFVSGEDLIDLSAIPGLHFIGDAGFSSNAKGEVRYARSGADIVLFGSTDAAPDAEFAILLQGVSALSAWDLLLS